MNFPAEKRRQVNSVVLMLFEILNWNPFATLRPRAFALNRILKRHAKKWDEALRKSVRTVNFAIWPDFSHFSHNFSSLEDAEKSIQLADDPRPSAFAVLVSLCFSEFCNLRFAICFKNPAKKVE